MRFLRGMIAGSLLAAGLVTGCAPSQEETEYLAQRAFLLRQNQGLREMIAEAERGSLVPTDRFLVGVDERVVAEVLSSQLPRERPLKKRFVLRLDRATVSLRDKFGAITIEGDIHLRAAPERRLAVRILGGLGAVAIDSVTDKLTVSIAIDRVELLQVGMLDKALGAAGKNLLSEQGRGVLLDALPTLQVPVALAQRIRLPAIREEAISLDSLVVPLDISVEKVIAVGGKLWLALNAEVGRVTGAEQGLGVAVKRKPRGAGTTPAPEPPLQPGAGAPQGPSPSTTKQQTGGGK
jgi:hypothetical protein